VPPEGETKKKQIYATMVRSNFNGWVEIDALSTMKYWEPAKNNFGLAIDVYDENDNHLNAKMHFHLQDCQAGKSEVCCFHRPLTPKNPNAHKHFPFMNF
jgi:hypothetical protein